MWYGAAEEDGNALEAIVRVYDRGVQERDGRAEERHKAEGKEEEEVVERDEGAVALQGGVAVVVSPVPGRKAIPSRRFALRTQS